MLRQGGFGCPRCFTGVGRGVGAGVGRGVGLTTGPGVGRGVGRSVGRGVGRGVGAAVGPGTGRLMTGGEDGTWRGVGNGVGAASEGVGVGLAGGGLSGGSDGGDVGDGLAGAGVVVGEDDGDTPGPPLEPPDGDPDPVTAGDTEGRAAVSPVALGPGARNVGTPNAPTASASVARIRFRIPRATTSRARWAIVTTDSGSSSGPGIAAEPDARAGGDGTTAFRKNAATVRAAHSVEQAQPLS